MSVKAFSSKNNHILSIESIVETYLYRCFSDKKEGRSPLFLLLSIKGIGNLISNARNKARPLTDGAQCKVLPKHQSESWCVPIKDL